MACPATSLAFIQTAQSLGSKADLIVLPPILSSPSKGSERN